MSYNRSTWAAGDTVTSAKLNNIEVGICDSAASLSLTMDPSTFVMTYRLINNVGDLLSTGEIDLPLETMIVGASYDEETKEIVFELESGGKLRVPVGDLVNGLQTEITPENKLASDLVSDELQEHKFVSAAEKNAWNAKAEAEPEETATLAQSYSLVYDQAAGKFKSAPNGTYVIQDGKLAEANYATQTEFDNLQTEVNTLKVDGGDITNE